MDDKYLLSNTGWLYGYKHEFPKISWKIKARLKEAKEKWHLYVNLSNVKPSFARFSYKHLAF